MESLGLTPSAMAIVNQSGIDSAGLLSKAEKAGKDGSKEDIKKVAENFEAIFIRLLLQELRKTVPENGLFPRSVEQDIYYDMIDTNLADELAKRQSLGIGEMIYRELSGESEKGLQNEPK